MNDPRAQQNVPAPAARRRRTWAPPRVIDHGSLRWFVRDISGPSDDGHTGTAGGGGTMQSKPPK